MARIQIQPTGVERHFGEEEIIVSKTDAKGRISYANDVFQRVAQFPEAELIGAPHSIVRHPDMPRCVFKLLWDTIQAGHEIFAYVLNMARSGDHYWVFAHVTPSFDAAGQICGFHSNRRKPRAAAITAIDGLYRALLREECKHDNRKDGLDAASKMMAAILQQKGVAYDEFVFSL